MDYETMKWAGPVLVAAAVLVAFWLYTTFARSFSRSGRVARAAIQADRQRRQGHEQTFEAELVLALQRIEEMLSSRPAAISLKAVGLVHHDWNYLGYDLDRAMRSIRAFCRMHQIRVELRHLTLQDGPFLEFTYDDVGEVRPPATRFAAYTAQSTVIRRGQR